MFSSNIWTFESVLIRWMNLQHIIQSEVSQKVKNKYVYSCIYVESRKKVLMNLSTGQQWRCRHREQTCGHSGGRRGWNWIKSSVETYSLPYVKLDSQWKFAEWCRELKSVALWQPRGEGGIGSWEGSLRGRGHTYIYG